MDGTWGMSARPGTDAAEKWLANLVGNRAGREPLTRKIATGRGRAAEGAVPAGRAEAAEPAGPRGPREKAPGLRGFRSDGDRVEFSLPEKMREAAAAVQADEGRSPEVAGRQQTFGFYGAIKAETAAAFELKIGRLAAESDGSASARAAVSLGYKLSASFSLSGSISAEALIGFGNGAELGLKGFDTRDFLDKFTALTARMMGGMPEELNAFLSLFSGANSGDSKAALESLVNRIFERFFGGGGGGQSGKASFSMSVQLEFSFEISGEFAATAEEAAQSDPLVLDLNGDGQLNLTTASGGARFDLLGTGQPVQTAFVTGGDAFLALDRNGNGWIDSGRELFGDQNGAANGFEELRKFDDNGDSVIDSRDAVFASLRLWRDNGDGISKTHELLSLQEAGVSAIRLDYRDVNKRGVGGNRIAQVAAYQRTDGRYGLAGDVLLNYLG